MLSTRKSVAVGASALLGVAVLAGCSSTSTTPTASAPASAPASATASSTSDGAQMLPPVIVLPADTTATAKVGDFIVFNVDKLAGTTIDTNKPDLLELSQAREEGGAQFNPGAKALAPGVAVVTVTNPDSSTREVTITIS